ncbi:protein FAR1-related sequence 5 [Tanacetum coccineum]
MNSSLFPSGSSLNALTEEIVAYENESDETQAVKSTLYDLVDDCIVAYMKYVAEAGFVVRRSTQKRLRNRVVKQKYSVCNRRVLCETSVATRTHTFLTGIKCGNAHMFISKMENRKKHMLDFSFDYLVENPELSAIFWVDEVSKYNYREFCDVLSFDATFKTNKYKMVFVPFTPIDNHRNFLKAPSIVVTGQDGAMRNDIQAEFADSKHRFLALGWLLKEIHVTWAHLKKKWTRLETYTKSLEDLCIQYAETASQA